jgi:hypothetical protein
VPTKTEIAQQIIDRLTERVKSFKPCAVCGAQSWTVDDGFAVIPVYADPAATTIPQTAPMWPHAVMYCDNCGNTHFLNLLILGFDLKSLRPTDE